MRSTSSDCLDQRVGRRLCLRQFLLMGSSLEELIHAARSLRYRRYGLDAE